MSSEYNIDGGDGKFKLEVNKSNKIIGCEVVSVGLDQPIILKLVQSSDGEVLYDSFPELPIDADAGDWSNLLNTLSENLVLGEFYLEIDKLTATVGILNIMSF